MPVVLRATNTAAIARTIDRRIKSSDPRRLRTVIRVLTRRLSMGIPRVSGRLRRSIRIRIRRNGQMWIDLTAPYARITSRRGKSRGFFRKAVRSAISATRGRGYNLTLVGIRQLSRGRLRAIINIRAA